MLRRLLLECLLRITWPDIWRLDLVIGDELADLRVLIVDEPVLLMIVLISVQPGGWLHFDHSSPGTHGVGHYAHAI